MDTHWLRLLGGDGEAEHVDQHEAEPVVEAEHRSLPKERQVDIHQQDLDQGHGADDQTGARGRPVHGDELVPRPAHVVLAGVARLFRDAARQQLHGAAEQVADAVALVFLPHEGEEHADDALAGHRPHRLEGTPEGAVDDAQPADRLADPGHDEHQVHGDARFARPAAHRVDVVLALRQQDFEVPVLPRVGRRTGRTPLHERAHFVGLRQERRFVPRERRHVPQQGGLGAERREAHGQEAHRLEQLMPALAPRGLEHGSVHADRLKQGVPVLERHGLEPLVIPRVIEDLRQEAAQERLVHGGRKQPPQQPSPQAAHEPGAVEDPGLRVEQPLAAGLEQRGKVAAERPGQVRSRPQQAQDLTKA